MAYKVNLKPQFDSRKDFYVYEFEDKNGKDIQLWIGYSEGKNTYDVIYDGALDISTTNKKELLARYPEFKEHLK